jgi:polyhydroxyalkanoate synthesis regulator phasin
MKGAHTMNEKEIRAELKTLRARRKEMIATYGNKGQKHPMHERLGGLNPAAVELLALRGQIARLEEQLKKLTTKETLCPLDIFAKFIS